MSWFLMIFHRNLEVMMFSREMKNYMVSKLILEGLNIAISLVLGGILICHVFLMISHTNLAVIMFSRKMKNYMVFILMLGSLNVAISFVLGMFSEFHMFSQVRFL